jgi:DNA-binding MarR family transcriptional regulator
MDTFLGIMRDVEAALQIRTMTFEYEIVACFFDYNSLTPQELARLSRCSHSALSTVLRRLEGRKVIYSEVHPDDKRSRVYRLSDKSWEHIRRGRIDYGVTTFEEWRSNGNTQLLRIYGSSIRKVMGIRHMTCEYQILLNLYYRSGITNVEFTDIVDASLTTFNRDLRTLCEMGLVRSERDPSDKRIKRYFISDKATAAIEDVYRRLYRWGNDRSLLADITNGSPQKVAVA